MTIPAGPPGLSLHLGLDSVSAFFLLCVFLSGTGIAAVQALTISQAEPGSIRMIAFCAGGTALSLLAADGVTLTIGMAAACGAISTTDRPGRMPLLVPPLLLVAVCLLTPAGFAPRFDTIRAAPIAADRAAAAFLLTVAATSVLAWCGPAKRCGTRAALSAGAGIPAATYLAVRIIADLSAAAAQHWWGVVMLLVGATIAIAQSWQSAAHPDIDGSVMCLVRRQTGLAIIGIGLALICRTDDLPAAASFALAASFLLAFGGGVAGTCACLAVYGIGAGSGSFTLLRLGGLVRLMPATSAALAASLLALSALPPGVGFAGLWLLLQSVILAPRIGGIISQLPLALACGAIALSAALATTASMRLAGIALLGRPRSLLQSGARDSGSPTREILLMLAGIAILPGILPGSTLRLLAEPSIRGLAGIPPGPLIGISVMSTGSPGYSPLPVLALMAMAIGAVTLAKRWHRKEAKAIGSWADGMTMPVGSPLGEPAAQSTGQGFLPALPGAPLLQGLQMPAFPRSLPVSPTGLIWLILSAFGALLLMLAAVE